MFPQDYDHDLIGSGSSVFPLHPMGFFADGEKNGLIEISEGPGGKHTDLNLLLEEFIPL